MLDLFRLVLKNQTRRLKDEDIADAAFSPAFVDFSPHYRKAILPKVREYELKRIEALKAFRSRLFTAIPTGIGGLLILGFFGLKIAEYTDPFVPFTLTIGLIGGLSWWVTSCIKEYQSAVKSEIYPLIFKFFGDDFNYLQKSPVSVGSLKPSDIIPGYDDEEVGDYVHGTHKGVRIELLEAKMTEEQGSGKNRRTVTIFKGMFVILGANKPFKGKTLIKKDYGMFNWAANGLARRERVKLEDPLFEKQFEVFADDQVEARYLLTTSFMDRLLKLVTRLENKGLQCSFYDSRLLFMIPTSKDYFKETSIFKPATFVEEINCVLDEMKIFFDIIDILKMDQKIGL